MKDIATLIDGLCIKDSKPEHPQNNIFKTDNGATEHPETLEPWERYYIDNVLGNQNGGGTTPENIDLAAPISERYEQIKLYRILGYQEHARRERTKMFFELEDICRAHFFPLFFVLDFEEYQTKRRWDLNGEKIKNINGAFYLFAKAKRERMREAGAWRGHEMENYKFCGAWEFIAK